MESGNGNLHAIAGKGLTFGGATALIFEVLLRKPQWECEMSNEVPRWGKV